MEGRKIKKIGKLWQGSHSSNQSFALAIISALAFHSPVISAGDISSQVPCRRVSNLQAFASSAPACFWACSHGPSASGFIAPLRPMLLRSHISASSFATRVTFEHGPNIDTVGAVLGFKNANGLRRRGLQTILASSQSSTTSTGRSVGIDLGTTNSAVAVVIDGKPVIIRNKLGVPTTPSVVSFQRVEGGKEGDVKILVGEDAVAQAELNPNNTYASVKRLIGRSITEASGSVADASQLKLLVAGDTDKSSLRVECDALGRSLAPEEISCHIIRTLLQDVERHFGGEKVTRAVITVPAYFNDKQRRATEAAGLLAGLERVKLLREPEAAALAYGLDKLNDELILVFDLGGGTFDVSVLEVGGGIIEVVWTGGDAFLGGDDFDRSFAAAILEDFIADMRQEEGVAEEEVARLRRSERVFSRVLPQARAAKVRLSSARAARVLVPSLLPNRNLNVSVTQKMFELRCAKLFERLAVPVRQVALMAGIELRGDDTSILDLQRPPQAAEGGSDVAAEGGVSKEQLKALKALQSSGRKQSRDRGKVKAEVHRVQKQLGNVKLRPFPGGRELTEVVLVGGGTRMSAVPRLLRSLTGIEARRTIDPDEAVALGAAVQGAIMDGEIQGLEVLSPLQAALLRGFARKKLAEQDGTYTPLIGDTEKELAADDDQDWGDEDEEDEEGEEDWFEQDDLAQQQVADEDFTPIRLD